MTKREQNRLREHSEPPHALTEHEPNTFNVGLYDVGEARRYTCPCGWAGWMRPGLVLR